MPMIGRLAEILAGVMVNSGAAKESDRDIYVYGLDVLLSTAASVLCILALGLLLGRILGTLIFLAFFIALRSVAGGFHASTHFRCFLVMLAAFAAAMAVLFFTPAEIQRWATLLLAAASLAAVAVLAPAPHENRPASRAELRKFRKLSLLLASVEALAVVLCSALGAEAPAIAGALGMLASAGSLVAACRRADGRDGTVQRPGC
jgi:accessory gene regulator B